MGAVLSVLKSFFMYLIPYSLIYLSLLLIESLIFPLVTNYLSSFNLTQTFTGLAAYFIDALKLDICLNNIFTALATAAIIRYLRRG
jgi:hypothetical protein